MINFILLRMFNGRRTVGIKSLRTLQSPHCFNYLSRNHAIMILQSHFLLKNTLFTTVTN
uniref:Uncharacterized protein n=1 Tax=Anguilla anguilla TaxID=7936 RepID=A0A0E9PF66_ANGAN